MNDKHITDLLDNLEAGRPGANDLATINAHVSNCPDCMLAWEASQVSGTLLQSRAAVTVEPPAFFATRVMAAVRESRNNVDSLSLVGLWKAARGLVTGMAAIVLILGGLSFATSPSSTVAVQSPTASASPFSTDGVLLTDGNQAVNYEPTNGQVYQAVFGPEDADADF